MTLTIDQLKARRQGQLADAKASGSTVTAGVFDYGRLEFKYIYDTDKVEAVPCKITAAEVQAAITAEVIPDTFLDDLLALNKWKIENPS